MDEEEEVEEPSPPRPPAIPPSIPTRKGIIEDTIGRDDDEDKMEEFTLVTTKKTAVFLGWSREGLEEGIRK